jgi:Ca-activated chloride channel family protein
MRHAIEEALAPRRDDGQRQVVLVTDGQIGFESEIVATILARLPKQSRVHVVGVGSAPNRTLTAHAPRAGRGIEVLVGLGEAAERAAARIVARTDAPIVVELELSGDALVDHAPRRLPDLFAGAPALIGMRARAGELVVRGRTASGPWEQRVRLVTPAEKGRVAVGSFYARERVEDLETDLAAGGEPRAVERGIEQLGLDFGLATRMTSWVAVSEHRTVDPGAPLRRERMPHELPFGASVEGLGLRACAVMPASAGQATMAARAPQAFAPMPAGMASPPPPPRSMAPRVMRPPAEAMRRVGGFLGGRGGAAGRRLQGRVVLRDAGVLVVEIGAQEAMTWSLPVEAEITWDDGTTTRVGVVAERSTHAGAVPPGAGVRLALDVADARAMASVAFDAGGERWIVAC